MHKSNVLGSGRVTIISVLTSEVFRLSSLQNFDCFVDTAVKLFERSLRVFHAYIVQAGQTRENGFGSVATRLDLEGQWLW